MPEREWTLEARLSGDILYSAAKAEFNDSLFPRTKEMSLNPDPASGNPASKHIFKANFFTDATDDVHADDHDALELGEEFAETMAALLSFASRGRYVTVEASAVHKDLGGGRKEVLLFPEMRVLSPPAMCDFSRLTMTPLDRRVRRALLWWKRALSEGASPVERLLSLHNAVDTLAGMRQVASTRARNCAHCGHQEQLKAGGREKAADLLSAHGCSPQQIDELWESRITIAHGRTDPTPSELHRFKRLCEVLIRTLGSALAEHLVEKPAEVPTPAGD